MRRLFLVRVACLLALVWMPDRTPCHAAGTPAPATDKPAVPVTSLIGLSRADVIALRGKPSGERQRDGVLVMVYPDGARLELREDRVVSASGAGVAQITASDGTRYAPGADGNIERTVRVIEAAASGEDDPAAVSPASPPPAPAQAAETVEPAPSGGAKPASAPRSPTPAAGERDTQSEVEMDMPPGSTPPPSVAAARAAAAATAQESLASGGADDAYHEPAPSTAVSVIGGLVGAVLHFGLTVLVLRIAVQVVGVPFFWPDLLKVAFVYLAVYEVATVLGRLGGLWEFLTIFRVHEVSSFIVMACALTWFKIAGSGLTALKIAVATKLVLTGLMLAIGLILAFGLGMIMR